MEIDDGETYHITDIFGLKQTLQYGNKVGMADIVCAETSLKQTLQYGNY